MSSVVLIFGTTEERTMSRGWPPSSAFIASSPSLAKVVLNGWPASACFTRSV
jgi:hypothetical protein